MGFSVSFGIPFLAMMSVLGSICFVAYTNSSASRAQAPAHAEKPTAALPQPEARLTRLVSPAEGSHAAPAANLRLCVLCVI